MTETTDREREIPARAETWESALAAMPRGKRRLAERTFRELEETHWRRLGIEPPYDQEAGR